MAGYARGEEVGSNQCELLMFDLTSKKGTAIVYGNCNSLFPARFELIRLFESNFLNSY